MKQTLLSVDELLGAARRQNVALWVENDRLRYRATATALEPELQQQLHTHRAEIIARLNTTSAAGPASRPPLRRAVRTDRPPLAFAQQRLWLLDQLEPNRPTYNIPAAFQLDGALNEPALEQALNEILCRHEVLRTTFAVTEDGTPFQVIAPAQPRPLPVVDVNGQPAAEQLMMAEARLPFDLAAGPLVRFQLLRIDARQHVLLWTMHHSVFDGWSSGIFRQELSELYAAFAAGRPAPLPELPVQYADFARWQRDCLTGPVLTPQVQYWKQQLAGAPFVLDLPADRPRPLTQSYRGAEVPAQVNRELTAQLKAFSRREGATLFMTLLAAYLTLLHRYTGQEDILVAWPSAGRDQVETEGLIGFFVNTMVGRGQLAGHPSFRVVLGRVRDSTLGALAHQDVPFEKLVEELQPTRDLSRAPLCQAMFVLQNMPAADLCLPGLRVTPLLVPAETERLDQTLELTETANGLTGKWNYATDLFDAARMHRMVTHFQTLLAGIVAQPERPIGELPLLSAAERQQVIVDWNATGLDYPPVAGAHQLVEQQVAKTPAAVAVECAEESLTYQELNARANQLARHLRGLGVGPESLVGICLDRNTDLVIALLAVLKAGGAYVPLDPAYPPERTATILADAGVQILLTTTGGVGRLPAVSARMVCLDTLDLAAESRDNLAPVAGPQNLAYVIFTSGSTGRPKGVAIEHRSTIAFLEWARTVFTPPELARVLFATSICFDVSVFEWLFPLCCGGTVVVAENALALPARGGTLFSTVPSVMAELLATTGLPAAVRTVCLAGEALPQTLVEKLYALPPVQKVYDLYGPTEDTTYSTFTLRRAGGTATIGRPIANTQAYLLDDRLQPVPVGVAGELHLGGAGLARGYLNRPELTAEKFIPNPFGSVPGARLYKTGDRARYRTDGNIEYLGRLDRQVKIRGFRIELGEIEAQLGAHETVGQAVVMAREDIPGDKRLVAYVVSANGVEPVPATLRKWLRTKLPEHMVPATMVVLPALPLTSNGKLDRRALPVPADQPRVPAQEFVAPRNASERELATLWEQLFKRQPIGVRDNFFDLGGHSLLAVRLFGQLQKLTGRNLPLVTLFQAPTIEQLAQVLKQDGWQAPWQCLVPIQPAGARPPFYCVHGVGGNILEFLDLAKYLPNDQPFYGIQAMGLDGTRSRQTLTVEEMAAHYIGEIRALQPTGPYYLGGSSFGGLVAYEMAQQLSATGETVGLLALFDTNGPGYPVYLPTANVLQRALDRWGHRVILHWDNLRNARGRERLTYLRVKAQKLGHGMVQGSLRRLWRGWLRIRQSCERFWLPQAIRQVQRVGHWAAEDYRPKPYPGNVTLFRATTQPRHIVEDKTLGWADLVLGELKIHDTPGHHGAIVRDPRARELARQLQEALPHDSLPLEQTP